MTDFFTPYLKNHCAEFLRARWALLFAFVLITVLGLTPTVAVAVQAVIADGGELRLESSEDGLYLSTTLQFDVPELAEQALNKGIPMFFVADAVVLRDRWYWSDRQVAETTRYFRLSYQPLTRRWRLNISSVPFFNNGLGVVLGQNFDNYADALAAIQRISRWKIAESDEIDANASHTVTLRFRLDTSQMPRPFQIGTVGRPGWNLLVSGTRRLAPEGRQ